MRASRPRTTRADRPPAGPLHVHRRVGHLTRCFRSPGPSQRQATGRGRASGDRTTRSSRGFTALRHEPAPRPRPSSPSRRWLPSCRSTARSSSPRTSRARALTSRLPSTTTSVPGDPMSWSTRHRLRLRRRRPGRRCPVAALVVLAAGTLARPDLVSPSCKRSGPTRPRSRTVPCDVPARTAALAVPRRSATRRCPCRRPRSRPPGAGAPAGRDPLVYVTLGTVSTPARATCSSACSPAWASRPTSSSPSGAPRPGGLRTRPRTSRSSGTSPRPTSCRGAVSWSLTEGRAA